ncbi:hypothetical protein, partial [Methylobacillus flagellatus]|uniref:hypothetical protein n=1 Tax=Methylobacillus flagellatus TaxID=405 RepID=UPI0028693B23
DMMRLWAKPGETIHGVRLRLKCRVCKEAAPNGPYPLRDNHEATLFSTSDRSIGLKFEKEE